MEKTIAEPRARAWLGARLRRVRDTAMRAMRVTITRAPFVLFTSGMTRAQLRQRRT